MQIIPYRSDIVNMSTVLLCLYFLGAVTTKIVLFYGHQPKIAAPYPLSSASPMSSPNSSPNSSHRGATEGYSLELLYMLPKVANKAHKAATSIVRAHIHCYEALQ